MTRSQLHEPYHSENMGRSHRSDREVRLPVLPDGAFVDGDAPN